MPAACVNAALPLSQCGEALPHRRALPQIFEAVPLDRQAEEAQPR